jgi:hypothetical protein
MKEKTFITNETGAEFMLGIDGDGDITVATHTGGMQYLSPADARQFAIKLLKLADKAQAKRGE